MMPTAMPRVRIAPSPTGPLHIGTARTALYNHLHARHTGGHVAIDVANLGGDFVIVRGDGSPLYHFTVVVDDAAMQITHVIRGEDHLSNTPKHILLFRALGYPVPEFAHLPLILNADRTKMSKRKSQTAVDDYIEQGFIREAFVNYLALLGWATGTEDEVLSLDEVVERVDLAAVLKRVATVDRGA